MREFANTSATSHQSRHSRASAGARVAGFQPFAPSSRRGRPWMLASAGTPALEVTSRSRRRARPQAALCAAWETAPRNGVLGALGEDWTPRFRCFRCSSQELSASEASCPAEILGPGGSGEQKNSENTRCSAAVFRCSLHQRTATIEKIALMP